MTPQWANLVGNNANNGQKGAKQESDENVGQGWANFDYGTGIFDPPSVWVFEGPMEIG